MFSARETLSASPSISRLLSTSCVWTFNPDSSSRIFSSRVPKRLSTPRLMRTLAFIEWVLGTSKQKKAAQKGAIGLGMVRDCVGPLLRAAKDHLGLLYLDTRSSVQ